MSDLPILSIVLLCPLVAFVLTVVLPERMTAAIKIVNAVAGLITVALSLYILSLIHI